MRLASSLMFLVTVHVIEAQNSFKLQFIGTEISEEEQTKLKLCKSKYCLMDANLLFTGATQNKSVTPCDDFKKFAVGTIDEYSVISDRESFIGLEADITNSYNLRLKKVLSEKENVKDTRVTKAMKKLYKRCVNSDYVQKLAVEEMREYLGAYGLKFYPEKNDGNFDFPKFVEEQSHFALPLLFKVQLGRISDFANIKKDDYDGRIELSPDEEFLTETFFFSFEEFFYEMFQIHQNGSYIETFKKDFKEIAQNLKKFHDNFLDNADFGSYWPTISVEELNNLTSVLNLDWSKIINNRIRRKFGDDETILVAIQYSLRTAAKWLDEADKKAVADMLAYYFLFKNANLVTVYQNDKFHNEDTGVKRSKERWFQCVEIFHNNMNLALQFLYSLTYNDSKEREGIENLIDDAKKFLVERIYSARDHDSNTPDYEQAALVNAIKVNVGYPKKFLEPLKIEEIYADLLLRDEQKFVNNSLDIQANFRKFELDPIDFDLEKLMRTSIKKEFEFKVTGKFGLTEKIVYIHPKFLQYPFYHYQRPRFFNSATVAKFFFSTFVKCAYHTSCRHFYRIYDSFQFAYEFYDDWLKAGNKDLKIGAHRMTDRQLFWLAAARVQYRKVHDSSLSKRDSLAYFQYEDIKGIRENYHCNWNRAKEYHEPAVNILSKLYPSGLLGRLLSKHHNIPFPQLYG